MRGCNRAQALILAILATTACSGATTQSNDSLLVVVGGLLINKGGDATLLKVDILWDGQVIGSESVATPEAALIPSGTVTTTSGTHTLAIRLAQHIGSQITYQGAAQTNLQTGVSEDIETGQTEKILSAGQSISFAVRLR